MNTFTRLQPSFRFAAILIALLGLSGCGDDQPDEEQLVTGLGLALSAETEDVDLVQSAVDCRCGPTCLIALKQQLRGDILIRFGWEIAGALADGALEALPLADKTKEVIEAALDSVDASVALGMHGDFKHDIDWEQSRVFEINKSCTVKWYAVYDPSAKSMTVIAECECTRSADSPCTLEYKYTVDENGAQTGTGRIRYL